MKKASEVWEQIATVLPRLAGVASGSQVVCVCALVGAVCSKEVCKNSRNYGSKHDGFLA